MGIMPGAIWKDVGAPRHFSNGTMRSHLGFALHCNDAQSLDLYGWIMGNHGMSCHFQVTKAGTIYQYIDTRYSSWCQIDGNDTYISIESQGLAGERCPAAQIISIGRILRWGKSVHGIPLQLAEVPGQRGLGWHGMGNAHGYNWGHPGCPGVRRYQRSAMLASAGGVAPPAPTTGGKLYQGQPVPSLIRAGSGQYLGLITGPAASHGGYNSSERPIIKMLQQRLIVCKFVPNVTNPYGGWADGIFEQPTKDAVTRFQRAHMPGTRYYGQVWADDWTKLFHL
jgi:hypothetical protein